MEEKVSNCCNAEINYGLGKIGKPIRCIRCGLICEENITMTKYKIRLFFKPIVSPRSAKGRIEIKVGSKNYVLNLVDNELSKCNKVIVEVKE